MTETMLTLLNRTATPSTALLEQAQRSSLSLIHLPLVETTVCDAPTTAVQAQVQASDWIVFCSPRAVAFAEQQLPGIWQVNAQLAAVGAGTARCIRAQSDNRSVLIPDQGDGAHALLRCPALHDVDGLRISVMTGRGGLDELEQTLSARGARTQRVDLYERVQRVLNEEQREICLRAKFAYVGSASFLDALLAAREGKPLPVWVPSARVAAHARRQGCTVDLCADSTDAALIARLEQFTSNPTGTFQRE